MITAVTAFAQLLNVHKTQTDTETFYWSEGFKDQLILEMAFTALFLTPSSSFLCLHLIVRLGTVFWVIATQFEIENVKLGVTSLLFMLIWVGLFYIQQSRELNRYFQQQDIFKKEQKATQVQEDLTKILNHQSDAIVVINS